MSGASDEQPAIEPSTRAKAVDADRGIRTEPLGAGAPSVEPSSGADDDCSAAATPHLSSRAASSVADCVGARSTSGIGFGGGGSVTAEASGVAAVAASAVAAAAAGSGDMTPTPSPTPPPLSAADRRPASSLLALRLPYAVAKCERALKQLPVDEVAGRDVVATTEQHRRTLLRRAFARGPASTNANAGTPLSAPRADASPTDASFGSPPSFGGGGASLRTPATGATGASGFAEPQITLERATNGSDAGRMGTPRNGGDGSSADGALSSAYELHADQGAFARMLALPAASAAPLASAVADASAPAEADAAARLAECRMRGLSSDNRLLLMSLAASQREIARLRAALAAGDGASGALAATAATTSMTLDEPTMTVAPHSAAAVAQDVPEAEAAGASDVDATSRVGVDNNSSSAVADAPAPTPPLGASVTGLVLPDCSVPVHPMLRPATAVTDGPPPPLFAPPSAFALPPQPLAVTARARQAPFDRVAGDTTLVPVPSSSVFSELSGGLARSLLSLALVPVAGCAAAAQGCLRAGPSRSVSLGTQTSADDAVPMATPGAVRPASGGMR